MHEHDRRHIGGPQPPDEPGESPLKGDETINPAREGRYDSPPPFRLGGASVLGLGGAGAAQARVQTAGVGTRYGRPTLRERISQQIASSQVEVEVHQTMRHEALERLRAANKVAALFTQHPQLFELLDAMEAAGLITVMAHPPVKESR